MCCTFWFFFLTFKTIGFPKDFKRDSCWINVYRLGRINSFIYLKLVGTCYITVSISSYDSIVDLIGTALWCWYVDEKSLAKYALFNFDIKCVLTLKFYISYVIFRVRRLFSTNKQWVISIIPKRKTTMIFFFSYLVILFKYNTFYYQPHTHIYTYSQWFLLRLFFPGVLSLA